MNQKAVALLNPSQAEDTFAQLSEVRDPIPRVSVPRDEVKQKCIILGAAIPKARQIFKKTY
jgi:hypothetical protein